MAERAVGAGPRTANERSGRLWSVPFAVVCGAHFLSYANGVMLEPILPLYLDSLGYSSAVIGMVFAAFSLASAGTRPFVGQAVDRWSARGSYVLGALTLAACSFSDLVPGLALLVAARTIHGFGWASINTAGPARASALTPAHRRAEALGYFSMMISLSALAPALAFTLMGSWGFPAIFVLSGLCGLGAALAAAGAPEISHPQTSPPESGFWGNLLEKRVMLPSLLNVLVNGVQPIVMIYVGLYAHSRGVADLSVYFVVRALSSIAGHYLARFADRRGRVPVAAAGFAVSLAGLGVMMRATDLLGLAIGGALCSVGAGMVQPSLLALTVDRVPPDRRGAALGTFTAAFQVGAGASTLLWGLAIQWYGFDGMFLGGIVMLLLGLAVLGRHWPRPADGAAAPVTGRP